MEKEFEDQNLYSVKAYNFGLLNKFYVDGIQAKKLIKDITSEKFQSIVIKTNNNEDEFHRVLTNDFGLLDDYSVDDDYSSERLMNIGNKVKLVFDDFEKSKKRKYDHIDDILNENILGDNDNNNHDDVLDNKRKKIIDFDEIYYMNKRDRSNLTREELNEFIKTIINKLIDGELSFPKQMINRLYKTTLTIIGGLSINYITRAKLDRMKAFSRDIYDSLSKKKLDKLLQSYKSRSTIIAEIKEIISFDPKKKSYAIKWNNNEISLEPEKNIREDVPKLVKTFHKKNK